MGRKAKGIRAERELVGMFWDSDWAATRVAGSGNTTLPSTDVIAGKNGRTLALECRTVNNDRIYIDKEKVNGMLEFTKKSGYEGWFAIKFDRKGWFFLPCHKIKNYMNLDHLEQNAKSFKDLLECNCKDEQYEFFKKWKKEDFLNSNN